MLTSIVLTKEKKVHLIWATTYTLKLILKHVILINGYSPLALNITGGDKQ